MAAAAPVVATPFPGVVHDTLNHYNVTIRPHVSHHFRRRLCVHPRKESLDLPDKPKRANSESTTKESQKVKQAKQIPSAY
jgi:hypothetical protein